MDDRSGPVTSVAGGCLVRLHVQPGAARTELAGTHGGAIKLRVAAPPVEGAANEKVIRYLAAVLGVPRRALSLERGQSSRAKTVRVAGLDAPSALARLLSRDPRAAG